MDEIKFSDFIADLKNYYCMLNDGELSPQQTVAIILDYSPDIYKCFLTSDKEEVLARIMKIIRSVEDYNMGRIYM